MVNRRQIPHTDLRISPICLGTMTFGTPVQEHDAIEITQWAIDHEINFIDTANMYEGYSRRVGSAGGVAEEILGQMLVSGDCERRGDTFLFPALQPRVVLRRCDHCEHEAPLASDDERCPSCGASMTVRRETKADADDGLYCMEE